MAKKTMKSNIEALLENNGFTKIDHIQWTHRNEAAKYSCKVDVGGQVVAIFGRFDEPRKDVGNPFSGKNNHFEYKKNNPSMYVNFEEFILNIKP